MTNETSRKVGSGATNVSRSASPPPVAVGSLIAYQCAGGTTRKTRHRKPFIGISDTAQLAYCEIQSTVSQLGSQDGYLSAAIADDVGAGVGVFEGEEIESDERRRIEQRLSEVQDSGDLDWDTRRLVGQLAESLELSGVSTERRHFDFGDFYVIGCPDGVTSDSVVEFGASRYPHLSVPAKRIQGNCYAVLWRRSSAHIVVVGIGTRRRIDEKRPADGVEAERWLHRAWSLLSGAEVLRGPDNTRKCVRCRFNVPGGCPFPRESRVPTLLEMKAIAAKGSRSSR